MKCDIQPFQNGDWVFIKENSRKLFQKCCCAAVMRFCLSGIFHTATIYTVKIRPLAFDCQSPSQKKSLLETPTLHLNSMPKGSDLCGGLDLSQSLALLESTLGLEAHNLEAVEVRQSLALGNLRALLGPVGLLPLGIDLALLPLLLQGGVARATDQTGDDEGGEEALVERKGLSGDNEAVI